MMSVAHAFSQYAFSAHSFALAIPVGGTSERAVAAASQLLDAFAKDFGLETTRSAFVAQDNAKTMAALATSAVGAASMNFAFVDGSEHKVPASISANTPDSGRGGRA